MLTRTQLRSLLKKAGRQRGIDAEAERLRQALRVPQMRQLPQVEQAMGRQTIALLRQLDAACTSADDLTTAAVESFETHLDAEIITRFPGLGSLTGARVLAEIGDDGSRFTDAKGLMAFAGAAPVTQASGRSLAVMARRVKNQRLASVGYVWAFAALTASQCSQPARQHRTRGREGTDPGQSAVACRTHGRLAERLPPTHALLRTPDQRHRRLFDLANIIITTRSLIRRAWTTRRWHSRPARRPKTPRASTRTRRHSTERVSHTCSLRVIASGGRMFLV